MPKKKGPKFPAKLFVCEELGDDGTRYYVADETTEGIADATQVAIYQLSEVNVMCVTRKLAK